MINSQVREFVCPVFPMKKHLCLFLLFTACCGFCFSQRSNVVDGGLWQLIDESSSELIDVNIVLKSQIEPMRLKALAASARDMSIRRGAVVKGLKEHSSKSQNAVLAILRSAESDGAVKEVSSHWISNTISCSASKDVILKLATHPDVLAIGHNKEVQIVESRETEEVQPQTIATSSFSATPHVLQVNADDVWEQGYTGKNVVVAILDSGTNPDHYDLKDHLWTGYADTDGDGENDDPIHGWNFIANNSNIADDYGHGTHCAGIVCGDGTIGNTTGVAPDATLMTVKTVSRGGGGTPTQMVSGVEFAVEKGANILSMSLGFKKSQISEADIVMLRRTFESVLASGVVVCAAAGNDGNTWGAPDNVDYPAACPPPYLHPDQQVNAGGCTSVICVGSVDSYDNYVSTSSCGPSTWQGTEFNDYPYDSEHIGLIRPDVCAPGELIYSLKHDENNKYKYMSGTSQATPCVAGVIALMLEKNPSLTPAQICETLETTAKKLSDTKNNYTGSGRVDALAAVNSIEAGAARPYVVLEKYTPKSMSAGANKEIGFVVSNIGNGAGSNFSAVLSTNDTYVTIVDGTAELGAIQNGGTAEGVFTISTGAGVPNGHTAYMTITVSNGEYSWRTDIEIEFVSSARIVYQSSTPGVVKPGNNVTLNVNMINKGTVATVGETKVELKTTSSYVTIVNGETMLGPMGVNEERVAEFVVNVNEAAPDNSSASFDVYAVPNNYTVAKDLVYEFETGLDENGYVKDGFDSWTTFDASSDGRNHPWWHSTSASVHWVETLGDAHSGKGQMMSETYCQASMQEYSVPVDNYLVSPKVRATADSKFSFWARIHSSRWFGEHFCVAVSETGNSSAEDFTVLQEWTITKDDGSEWIEYTVDLSPYEGKDIYVAIRHFFTAEQWKEADNGWGTYVLHVDDVMFRNVIDVSQNFVYDNYSYFSLAIEGNPLAAPANVTASAVNAQSITVSWSAVANAQRYNIYRNGAYLASTTALSYTDSGLSADTEYSYSVAAVYNNKEYERSVAVSATTGRADYSLKLKALSTETLNVGENTFGITIVNNGKYEQKSKSALTLTTSDPYVTITSGSINMNYLPVDKEDTKNFTVEIDKLAPDGHVARFDLDVTELYEDENSWDFTFDMTISNSGARDVIAQAKAIIDGWGVGYPNEAAKQEYLNAVGAALMYADILAAQKVLYAADAKFPVDGKAYYIKAKFNDGTFRYLYDNGESLWTNSTAGEKPSGCSGIFVFRKISENRYALVNNNGKYMVYYADGQKGAGGVSNGFADSYELGDYDAEITFAQGTRVKPTNPATLDVATEFFGGFAMQAYNSTAGQMYYMMAGDVELHYAEPNSIYYLYGNRSSVFYLEDAEYANAPRLNDISSSTLITGIEEEGMCTFSAPFPTLLPDGVKAYYGKVFDDKFLLLEQYAGEALPANEGFILVGDIGSVTMKPALNETVQDVENAFSHSAGAPVYLEDESAYILAGGSDGPGLYLCNAGTIAMNKAYLPVEKVGGLSSSVVLRFGGETNVGDIQCPLSPDVLFDLSGRRVQNPQPGIYITNGRKVLIR